MMNSIDIKAFKGLDANPGGTLQRFEEYTERMELLFQLVFRKADGTAYSLSDGERKAMLLFKGGRDMKELFQHVGRLSMETLISQLSNRTNSVVQRNMLFSNFFQGQKSFEKWSQEVSNAAKLISYENYDWKQAAVDAIVLQTSNPKLRERALQDNVSYDELMQLGISKEQSVKGAHMLEQASGLTNADVNIQFMLNIKLMLHNKPSNLQQGDTAQQGDTLQQVDIPEQQGDILQQVDIQQVDICQPTDIQQQEEALPDDKKLHDISAAEASHINERLAESHHNTRSKGQKLTWNRTMNPKDVIIQIDCEDD